MEAPQRYIFENDEPVSFRQMDIVFEEAKRGTLKVYRYVTTDPRKASFLQKQGYESNVEHKDDLAKTVHGIFKGLRGGYKWNFLKQYFRKIFGQSTYERGTKICFNNERLIEEISGAINGDPKKMRAFIEEATKYADACRAAISANKAFNKGQPEQPAFGPRPE